MVTFITTGLEDEIKKIRTHTLNHADLQQCHHFMYNLRLSSDARAKYVVIGMNPGETSFDYEVCDGPSEESSLLDYRNGIDSPSRERWISLCKHILGTESISLSELFFWSSSNLRQLKCRIGSLRNSRHFAFCAEMNDELLAFHKPKAVVLPGLGLIKIAVENHCLKHVRNVLCDEKRLVVHYKDKTDTPWIFTKHWTGSFGFSNDQRDQIARYIRSLPS